MFNSVLRSSCKPHGCANKQVKPGRSRPAFEPLESRQLLSSVFPPSLTYDAAEALLANPNGPAVSLLSRKEAAAPAYTTTGAHPYFPLRPGCSWESAVVEGSQRVRMVMTVLNETAVVDRVTTRIVESNEYTSINGKKETLTGINKLYLVINKRNGDLVIFGMDARSYDAQTKKWHTMRIFAGLHGLTAGTFLPGKASKGITFKDSLVDASSTFLVTSTTTTVRTPAGTFKNCLVIKQYDPAYPTDTYYTYYAPGVGFVATDNGAKLTKYTLR